MSLVVLSSAQDKYNVRGFMKVSGEDSITQQNSMGIQNPNSFTNNINPVFKIKANSEVCLKSATYNRSGGIKIGHNESFALYHGQELRERWGGGIAGNPRTALYDTTSFPIPIPLEPGNYNMNTLSTMINKMLDWYVSYPDLFNNIWCEPASSQSDGTNNFGLVWRFNHGNSALNDSKYAMIDAKAWKATTGSFSYGTTGLPGGVVQAANVYQTPALAVAGFESNSGIIENIPLSLRGGEMKWTTSGADTGWRIGLTRPTVNDGVILATRDRKFPPGFSGTWFFDYCVEYSGGIIYLWHAVYNNGVMEMREVEYYNNTATDFDPVLSSDAESRNLTSMYRGTHLTGAILTSDPKTISIKFYGEDTVVAITNAADAVFILTDSRLCLNEYGANPVEIAQTPTRNRFFKPIGLTTAALYPKVELIGSTGATKQVTLTVWNGITHTSTVGADRLANTDYKYPQPFADVDEDAEIYSSGSSFWSRSQSSNDHQTKRIAGLVDSAHPYQSESTALQKQYVGLSGPETGAGVVPIRYATGNPEIPLTAVDDSTNCPVAWGLGLILMGSDAGLSNYKTAGVYCSQQTDVSAAFGFPDKDSVFQSRDGSSYIFSNAPTRASTSPPTDTVGAFYGWYFGSDTAPIFTRGTLFVRVPQLTHQSYNFGKGIPSKVIGQLPLHTHAGGVDNDGETFYHPPELTYLDLNNPAELNLNDLTIEIVDKTEEVVTELTGSTTIVLHIKGK